MANPKSAIWYGGGTGSYVQCANPGTAFYVDGTNGLDTNDGLTPSAPFLTVTAALAACTSGANDYVFILDYPSTAPGTETFPIALTKSHVHLIGVPDEASQRNVCLFCQTGGVNTLELGADADDCEIAGIEFGATTAACILASAGTPFTCRVYIHHCEFGWIRTCQDGLHIQAGGADTPHWLVEHNRFGENCTRAGIYNNYNSTRSFYRNNFFKVASGAVGIHLAGLCTGHIFVLDNYFQVTDNAAGEAITTSATATGMATGNVACQGKVAMGNIPWVDGGSFDWGWNVATGGPSLCVMPA
jgi:hypothetical protein